MTMKKVYVAPRVEEIDVNFEGSLMAASGEFAPSSVDIATTEIGTSNITSNRPSFDAWGGEE